MNFEPIGVIHSAFDEKFGIPRQPGLTPSLNATIEILPPFASPEAVRGLEQASHIWLIFLFSATAEQGWKPLVRPPRLGGNRRLGVFASRSPFRPNPIGLSPVQLTGIRQQGDSILLDVVGADLLDGTPILDIKPYLPYADSIPEAHFALAEKIETLELPIHWSEQAEQAVNEQSQLKNQPLATQIEELLRCDPRPAYQRDPEREYGVSLHQLNIRFRISETAIEVLRITVAARPL
ncbi:tRNA (N6-threonylcarbamoyladenosine(37)-N6)-methyltransferase TrmO [Marinobacterium mangrovicola]|uniref:tRNA-Thr(GGU) m(6)t(6)A37 methyltransferase TsaA n=1 Tax=Marinobacterium mangrovicola TaxID=1476959 RepID=A0A4R1G6D7_9GAMM|nr:tRNA (N6-threonylcarbamoyladenosine(37)-N6)-methyltransferase TrmO [Marinobacterium mangrovicola]TCK03078.1 tRNA-Thr(GGU) m(6)t(6)A37 methyltransferase TsaA [Marinobacterium mangrovicola]